MSKPATQSPAHAALLQYKQADMDGTMVTVSRQAIHEVSDELTRLLEERERLVEALRNLQKDASRVSRLGAQTGPQWTGLSASLALSRAALASIKESEE